MLSLGAEDFWPGRTRTATVRQEPARRRRDQVKVVPCCEFAAARVERRPAYRGVLADEG
jgi:hypothetical protein